MIQECILPEGTGTYARGQYKAGIGSATYNQNAGEPLQTAFRRVVEVSRVLDGTPVSLRTNEGIRFVISSEDELGDALAALREINKETVLDCEGDHYTVRPGGSLVNLFDAAASLATTSRESINIKFWGVTVTVEPDTGADTVEKNFWETVKGTPGRQPA